MRTLGTLLAVALAVTACGDDGSSGDAVGPDRASVRVLLDWFPNPDHVALYTALDGGTFEQAGLDVTLTPPSNPADPIKLVASGTVDLGISYEPDILIAEEQGAKVTAVAALIPVALNSLMAVGDSDVDAPEDLAGRTVGTPGLPSDDVYLAQIAEDSGVDAGSIRKVNVGANLVSSMLSGHVDATVGAYRNIEGVQLEEQGRDPLIVPVTDVGVPEYNELVLIANRDRLARDSAYQDTVRRFLRALRDGTRAATDDPEQAAASIREVAKGYDKALIAKMVDATLPLLRNERGFGRMDPEQWRSFAQWLRENKMVDGDIDVGPIVTNDYLPSG